MRGRLFGRLSFFAKSDHRCLITLISQLRTRKKIMKNFLRFYVVAFTLIAGLTASINAQTSAAEYPGIKIKNFGQMDTNYFRGGQPKEQDYKALADLGINTVVDLRNDPTDYEKPTAEALGMKYI